MKRIGMILLCLGAVACNGTERKIQDAVRSSLRDPASAIFGETRISPSGTAACVVVNARNSFGGYTGDQVASVYLDTSTGTWEAEDISQITMDLCMQTNARMVENSVENSAQDTLSSQGAEIQAQSDALNEATRAATQAASDAANAANQAATNAAR